MTGGISMNDIRRLNEECVCFYCGNPMKIDEGGVSNHLLGSGDVDHDADADHVAVEDRPTLWPYLP
jgi:hypothetical protein